MATSLPARTLVVAPAEDQKDYGKAQILKLNSFERKQLLFGHYTQVWMSQPHGPPRRLFTHNISIPALMAISPVIKEAIESSGFANNHTYLDKIALPRANPQAYQIIFNGLNSSFDKGIVNTIQSQTTAPLFWYYHIIDVCEKLGITHTADKIQTAFDTLSIYRDGERCCIDREDVRCAYRDCPPGHPLRYIVVEKIARGILAGKFFGGVAGRVYGVQEEYKEFHKDLEARKKELWLQA